MSNSRGGNPTTTGASAGGDRDAGHDGGRVGGCVGGRAAALLGGYAGGHAGLLDDCAAVESAWGEWEGFPVAALDVRGGKARFPAEESSACNEGLSAVPYPAFPFQRSPGE